MGRNLFLDGESLFSKWGFSDGDILGDWWIDNIPQRRPLDDHDILYALVQTFLVPEMHKAGHYDIGVQRIYTVHNPVRIYKLNGKEFDDHAGTGDLNNWDKRYLDPPVEVELTPEQVTDLVNKLIIKEKKESHE